MTNFKLPIVVGVWANEVSVRSRGLISLQSHQLAQPELELWICCNRLIFSQAS
jgi:hypothetical protein